MGKKENTDRNVFFFDDSYELQQEIERFRRREFRPKKKINKNVTDCGNIEVFSRKIAGNLMMDGYILLNVKKSYRNEKCQVFFFKDLPGIQEKIKEYGENKHGNK